MGRCTSMGVIGNLNNYTQFQAAEAMGEAAKNPGSMAAGGMGMGMGFAMADQIGRAMSQQGQQPQGTPPPIPQQVLYYVAINGQQNGPYDMNSVMQQIQTGTITPDILIWKQGMPQWTPAGQVSELAQLFGSVPPPIPQKF